MKKTYMPFLALLCALYSSLSFASTDRWALFWDEVSDKPDESSSLSSLVASQKAPQPIVRTPEDPQGQSLLLIMLPDEILVHILSFVPKNDLNDWSKTCKKLERLVPTVSRTLYLSTSPEFNVEAFLNFCCTRASAKFWPDIKTIKGKAHGIFWDPTYPYDFTEQDDLCIPYQLLPNITGHLDFSAIERLGIMPQTIEDSPANLRENPINLKLAKSITKVTLTDYKMGKTLNLLGMTSR